MTNENSVRVNLRDLFELEADRREREAEAARAAERERSEADRREADRREREAEAARTAERERSEAERRDAALEARLQSLKDELAAVRAQREETRLKLAENVGLAGAPKRRRGGWLAVGMSGASLALALVATALAWPQAGPPTPGAEPATEHRASEPVAREASTEPVPERAATLEDAPPAEETVARAEPRPEPPRPRPPATRPAPRPAPTGAFDLGLGVDDDAVLSDEFLRNAGN